MLLSGGDPPAQEWFMVQTKSKPRVQRQRLQVQRIFRVKLNAFQSRPDTPYFWLQLEGPRENMGRAKVKSFSPPITSSQTLLPLLAPPAPPRGPQRSPDLDSAVWRAGTGPSSCLSRSAALGPSIWFLLFFLPHPSLACHFCPSSALREARRRVSPREPSLARAPHLQPAPPSGEQLKVLHFCSLCNIPLCSPPRAWKAQVFLPPFKSP